MLRFCTLRSCSDSIRCLCNCLLFALLFSCHLNLATGKFTGYARHWSCRRIHIHQGSSNKADSVELPVPKGSKYEKIILMNVILKLKTMGVIYWFAKLNYFLILRMHDLGVTFRIQYFPQTVAKKVKGETDDKNSCPRHGNHPPMINDKGTTTRSHGPPFR